jgi:transglutaminase-like putative cysteine protease
MKTLRVLILGLLFTAIMLPFAGNGQTGQPSSPVAEVITPDIQALARGLQNNPVQIFNYVHDHIRFDLYFGSQKGAEITLLEKSGNDFDQCALLVALLRAAGYSPGYEFGLAEAPYDATGDNDWQHWLQASLVNTNWGDTSYFFPYLIGTRGYPTYYTYDDDNSFGLQHVWVTLTIGGTNYLLDPTFKISEPVTGISLTNAMGFSASGLLAAAGGTDIQEEKTSIMLMTVTIT